MIDLTPRQVWLRNRVNSIVRTLQQLKSIEDWDKYKEVAIDLAKELTYACTEWEKCYKD